MTAMSSSAGSVSLSTAAISNMLRQASAIQPVASACSSV